MYTCMSYISCFIIIIQTKLHAKQTYKHTGQVKMEDVDFGTNVEVEVEVEVEDADERR